MTYQELYDYYMANGGNTSGGDGSGFSGTPQVTLPDGRILMPDGQGRLSIMEVDRNQGGTNVTAYNPDGTTEQYFQGDNLNRRSPLQQLVLAAATLGGAAAIGNAGPYIQAYLSGSGASEGLVSAASNGSWDVLPAAGVEVSPVVAGSTPEAYAGITATNLPEAVAGTSGTTAFGASNGTLPTTIGSGGPLSPAGASAVPGSVAAAGGASGILAGAGTAAGNTGLEDTTGAFVAAPGTSVVTSPGSRGPTAADARTVLERILSGSGNIDDLLRVISGVTGAVQQNNAGNALLERANAATPNRDFYEGQLRQTYENPTSYLSSPEYQAIQSNTLNKLQRSDAAGGRLANDYGRQLGLNNQGYENLNRYRSTLGTIVGQNQNVYSGQNSMFAQGTNMTNSAANPIINAATSRPGNTGSGSILSQLLAELQGGQ